LRAWSDASESADLAVCSWQGRDSLHSRYYNFTIARFRSIDPVRGNAKRPRSFNLFAYVGDNPINFVDPLGLKPWGFGGTIAVHGDDPCPWMPPGMPCDMESTLAFLEDARQRAMNLGLGSPEYAAAVLGRAGWLASPIAEAADRLARGFDLFTGWVSAGDSLILGGDPTQTGIVLILALIPGPFDNAAGPAVVKAYDADAQALLALAKEAMRKGGVTREEAAILKQWAQDYRVPFRGPEIHPGRAFDLWHILLGPYRHIPVR